MVYANAACSMQNAQGYSLSCGCCSTGQVQPPNRTGSSGAELSSLAGLKGCDVVLVHPSTSLGCLHVIAAPLIRGKEDQN